VNLRAALKSSTEGIARGTVEGTKLALLRAGQ
jgi:hypothetical protein